MKRYRVIVAVAVGALVLAASAATAQDTAVRVYLYSHLLRSGDQLMDGPNGAELKIDQHTLLIWVDKEPGLFFGYPTSYILISRSGVRVEDGMWWPILNGKTVLYTDRQTYGVPFPFDLHDPQDQISSQ